MDALCNRFSTATVATLVCVSLNSSSRGSFIVMLRCIIVAVDCMFVVGVFDAVDVVNCDGDDVVVDTVVGIAINRVSCEVLSLSADDVMMADCNNLSVDVLLSI